MIWRREGVWLHSIDMASRVSRSEKAFVFPIRLCVSVAFWSGVRWVMTRRRRLDT